MRKSSWFWFCCAVVGCSSGESDGVADDGPTGPIPSGGSGYDAARADAGADASAEASPGGGGCDDCGRDECPSGCTLPHARSRCASSGCVIDACDDGYADCNGEPSDGCETHGSSCNVCGAGLADCDGNALNGCETDIDRDPQSCGACGYECGGAHALSACVSGRCELDCLPGFADCDGDDANGCETNIDGDPLACGACGHGCLGQACGGGTCGAPSVVTTAARVTSLAVDGSRVFWLESARAGLWSSARDGSDVRAVSSRGGGRVGLAVDDTHAYWIDRTSPEGALVRATKDGAQVAAIVSGLAGDGFVAVGPRHVYWTQSSAGTAWIAGKDGTNARPFATGLAEPMGIAADASGVYWVTTGGASMSGTVMAAGPDGTSVRTLVRAQRLATSVALDAGFVYWTTRGDRTLARAPKSGAGMQILASGFVDPRAVAIEGAYAYVADAGRGVTRVSTQGGAVVRLALGDVEPWALAIDGAWLTYAEASPTFAIRRVAR